MGKVGRKEKTDFPNHFRRDHYDTGINSHWQKANLDLMMKKQIKSKTKPWYSKNKNIKK